jgi:hypothetical protein
VIAITLQQPWAWAFLASDKRIENREYSPREAGFDLKAGDPVAIHAGLTYDLDSAIDLSFMLVDEGLVVPDKDEIDLGAVVAVARFREVTAGLPLDGRQQRWRASTRFAWVFDEVWRLPVPVKCRGQRKLWPLPPEVDEEVAMQWGKAEQPLFNPFFAVT